MEIKPLAFYLPQYHPIKENNKWWGRGFTEWTNVTKAKPLFKGHRQPVFPADLGYYDLRVPEVRSMQAEMARNHGVHGFVYYHYWFGNGQKLLEKPLQEVVRLGEPDFPFCVCWANQTWTGIWHGSPKKTLIEQVYPGEDDIEKHFKYLLSAFMDERYITVSGSPLFIVYDAPNLADPKQFTDSFRQLAVKHGFPGIYIMAANIGSDEWDYSANGFDGKISNAHNKAMDDNLRSNTIFGKIKSKIDDRLNTSLKPAIIDHRKLSDETVFKRSNVDTYPIVLPNWDNTPRSGTRGVVLDNSSPQLFSKNICKAKDYISKHSLQENFVFIKSWNEWAEGNYLEPDTINGYAYLESLLKNVR